MESKFSVRPDTHRAPHANLPKRVWLWSMCFDGTVVFNLRSKGLIEPGSNCICSGYADDIELLVGVEHDVNIVFSDVIGVFTR